MKRGFHLTQHWYILVHLCFAQVCAIQAHSTVTALSSIDASLFGFPHSSLSCQPVTFAQTFKVALCGNVFRDE